jgi:hypothetical protein
MRCSFCYADPVICIPRARGLPAKRSGFRATRSGRKGFQRSRRSRPPTFEAEHFAQHVEMPVVVQHRHVCYRRSPGRLTDQRDAFPKRRPSTPLPRSGSHKPARRPTTELSLPFLAPGASRRAIAQTAPAWLAVSGGRACGSGALSPGDGCSSARTRSGVISRFPNSPYAVL